MRTESGGICFFDGRFHRILKPFSRVFFHQCLNRTDTGGLRRFGPLLRSSPLIRRYSPFTALLTLFVKVGFMRFHQPDKSKEISSPYPWIFHLTAAQEFQINLQPLCI
jgi:hypothetical protein